MEENGRGKERFAEQLKGEIGKKTTHGGLVMGLLTTTESL